ncbi:MAG: branched-chain amino acid ABC transporter permease [Bacillota bacterium]|nr:branched-chain amino acid ABC transporter permease [Bacillota bacterium]
MNLIRIALRYIRNEILVLPTRVIAILFVIGLLVLPLLTQDMYILRILAIAAIFAIYAASWDLLSGFVGQVSFGHALFFGVAAYTTALLNLRFGISPILTIPIGALASVLVGLLVGIPCLRLKGPYLGLATLAFPIMLMGIIFIFPGFFGGELGISGITRLAAARLNEYYIAVVFMLILCFVMWKITDSKVGIIFHAIREDEIAVRASGINTIKYKLFAFCLSGFFAGLAGGLYTHFLRIAGPSMLAVLMSFQAIIWTIFGGVATIYGAVTGVFILFPTLEILRTFSDYRMLIFALIVLLVLRLMPQGITVFVRDKLERECPRCKVRNVFTRKECRVCYSSMK